MKNFILFLSKTDLTVYKYSSAFARNIRLSLGVFVLLTGILAFFSGYYAINNLFMEFDWKKSQVNYNPAGFYIAPLIAFLYAAMIVFIDREIVAAKSKWAMLLRLPLAIVIGLVVSVPIEMKILEGRIEKQLIEEYKIENNTLYQIKQDTIAALNAKKTEFENDISLYQQEINRWSEIMEQETVGRIGARRTGIPGQGPAYEEARRNMELHQKNLSIAEGRLDRFLKSEYKQNLSKFEQDYADEQVSQQFDLLSKYQALARMKAQDTTGATSNLTMGITFLFILFEIIPSLMKLFAPTTEYDAILEARRLINIQLTHAVANEGIEELNSGDLQITFQNLQNRKSSDEIERLGYLEDIKKRIILD